MATTPFSRAVRVTKGPSPLLLWSSTRPQLPRKSGHVPGFLIAFTAESQPTHTAVDYFRSLDWPCGILDNENYEAVPFFSRHFNHDTGANRFFGRVVNTDTAIPHFLSFQLKHLRAPVAVPRATEFPATDMLHRPGTSPDLICLISLGQDLEAHPSVVHGGFQGVLFDEVMRFTILSHYNRICSPGGPQRAHYTAQMSISYQRPMKAPGDVLARSWLTGRSGRKWFTIAEILDSANNVLTVATSVWITDKPPSTG